MIPQKQTVTAEAWDLLLKDDKSMEWKTDTDVNNSDYFTLQSKEGAEREREEREREREREREIERLRERELPYNLQNNHAS